MPNSQPPPRLDGDLDRVALFQGVQEAFASSLDILQLVAASPSRALFVARDRVLRRKVGLRVFIEQDHPARAWFERETELLAALDHPILRTVYAGGFMRDWAWRTVKWIEGESLRDTVARGPRPIPGVLQLARSLVSLLDYLHTQRIVIRRLAPSTVMIDAYERPSVTDLRFANVLLDAATPDPDSSKEPFVAPEVRDGSPGDPGSDIFSAAALLYFAVTGQPPAPDPRDIVAPRAIREACPVALERVIMRGLRPEPPGRYLTAVEMLDDLASDLGDYNVQVPLAPDPDQALEDPRAWEKRLRRALGDEYELFEELGSGGFGRVYLVRDLALEREVALKVLHPYLTVDPGVVERFRREARVAAQVVHPNIANTYDIGGRAGLIWYTMEYVRGRNLARVVQAEGPIAAERVVEILLDALGALDHAHKRGLVHRDLKPENLLIEDGTGVVQIADFGLAIALQVKEGFLGASSQSGTPDFAAPEQLLGERVDHRTDIYSLTLVGFYALTGLLPFGSAPVDAILARRAAGEMPELLTQRPGVPERLLRVFARGAARDPEQRFTSASEFAIALRETTHPTRGLFSNLFRRFVGPT
jgi:serine/threonine-protein kinase